MIQKTPSKKKLSYYPFGSTEYRQYFRTEYVEKDAGKIFLGIKNGNVYLTCVFLYLISIVGFIWYQLGGLTNNQMMLVPLYFLISNFMEYILHRFPMHRKTKGVGFLYEHVTVHHNFYNNEYFYYENSRDYMAVFLPFLYSLFISATILTVGSIIYLLADLNNALFFTLISYSYYLMYELLHFCSHTKQDSLIKKLPFMKRLAQFHLDHHQAKYMNQYNFNITFPIFDFVFNTTLKTSQMGDVLSEPIVELDQ